MASTGREPAANEGSFDEPSTQALLLMEKALAVLDVNDAPPDIGAHLDIAIHRLRNWIAASS